MRFLDEYKTDHYDRLSHKILLAVCAVFVLGTTMLNIAFSLAPMAMVQLVRSLIA
jgi:hypothetical protein